MLQFPAFMAQYPSPTLISPSALVPCPSPHSHNEEFLLAMEESALEDKWNEIRKTNNNVVVIGKTVLDNDKEDMDADADEDEADNVEESEGDEFEQETG
ncbi:uncharacterized protein [Aristolochia californica]|uniref:uncharacterized protein n=1 Tax=Aristolochia californica TaxID=171875 RepID=UPI0035E1A20F